MAVIFQATIKMNSNLEWYIELKDTVDGRVEECKDVDEFAKKVEELGDDYGGHVDEVKWLKDENVPEQVMDELRVKMAEHRAEIEEKTGETITPLAEEEK
ncbi:MAG: hypothetical protein DRG78_14700 [Epsilonproteobacteria bacterium]|nr:MAG: hypothetical protein DRG78_14700 [Campylobacterota bacterium]